MRTIAAGAIALLAATTTTHAQTEGGYFWTGPQDIGWYRTTAWPENTAGFRMPLYRYHTEFTPDGGSMVTLRTLSFDVNESINRRELYDAKSGPLPETRGIRTVQSGAISYILTHYTQEQEPDTLDYVATKGLSMWKLQNGTDGKPYMRSIADVDKVHLLDDHNLNQSANELVKNAWGKTVVRRGDRFYLFTRSGSSMAVAYVYAFSSWARYRESRRFRLPGVKVELKLTDPSGKASFARSELVTEKTVHTNRWGGTGALIWFNGSRTATVTAKTVGVWGETIAPSGDNDFQTQIGDGPVLGKKIEMERKARVAPRRSRSYYRCRRRR